MSKRQIDNLFYKYILCIDNHSKHNFTVRELHEREIIELMFRKKSSIDGNKKEIINYNNAIKHMQVRKDKFLTEKCEFYMEECDDADNKISQYLKSIDLISAALPDLEEEYKKLEYKYENKEPILNTDFGGFSIMENIYDM